MTLVPLPGISASVVQNCHLEQYLDRTTNPQSKDGRLVLDATTKTFRYLDAEELAAKREGARGAAKGGKK
jgi:Tfp pilus assembly protein PilO